MRQPGRVAKKVRRKPKSRCEHDLIEATHVGSFLGESLLLIGHRGAEPAFKCEQCGAGFEQCDVDEKPDHVLPLHIKII